MAQLPASMPQQQYDLPVTQRHQRDAGNCRTVSNGTRLPQQMRCARAALADGMMPRTLATTQLG